MFRNMWDPSQFNAYRSTIGVYRKVYYLTTRTVTFYLTNNVVVVLRGNRLATRHYSSTAAAPERLASEHIRSGKPTTSAVINSILVKQKVSVTSLKLETLLTLQWVEFDLPITNDKQSLF